MFDAERFLSDYNIQTYTDGPDTQEGWINIQCPECNDHANHGGFNLATGYYNCWRCGKHYVDNILVDLLLISKKEANNIIDEYQIDVPGTIIKKEKKIIKNTFLELPPGTKELNKKQRKYLIKRKYDPDELARVWKLQGTQNYGDYSCRIIAPIFLDGRLVSYQGRDHTGRSSLRYKACKIKNEIIHHKHLLYGIDYVLNRQAVLVEGIMDVYRLGPGAVASFGTSVTTEQIHFISKRLDTLFILFDTDDELSESKAYKVGQKLVGLLDNVFYVSISHKGDPGSMDQDDAKNLMEELLK
jgi:hypothetical protein